MKNIKVLLISAACFVPAIVGYFSITPHYIGNKQHVIKYGSWYSERHNSNDTTYGVTLGGDSTMYVYTSCNDSGYTYRRFDKARLFASGY